MSIQFNQIPKISQLYDSWRLATERASWIKSCPSLSGYVCSGVSWQESDFQVKMREHAEEFWNRQASIFRGQLEDMGIDTSVPVAERENAS